MYFLLTASDYCKQGFTRLNTELRKRGFTVEEVPYAEIAKMGIVKMFHLTIKKKYWITNYQGR